MPFLFYAAVVGFLLLVLGDKFPNGLALFGRGVWILLCIGFWSLLAWIAYRLVRAAIPRVRRGVNWTVRAYYFAFHPHPAAALVESAMQADAPLDGVDIAAALGELPSDNSILRAVRMEQAARLVQEMQAVSRARIRAMEKEAAAEYERAAVAGSQEAIALAAVALERARAAYQASQIHGGTAHE